MAVDFFTVLKEKLTSMWQRSAMYSIALVLVFGFITYMANVFGLDLTKPEGILTVGILGIAAGFVLAYVLKEFEVETFTEAIAQTVALVLFISLTFGIVMFVYQSGVPAAFGIEAVPGGLFEGITAFINTFVTTLLATPVWIYSFFVNIGAFAKARVAK